MAREQIGFRFGITCPHCDSKTTARTSKGLSRTLREIVFQCNDFRCGHTFVANLEAVRTLSPSAMPNGDVRLPISEHVRERVMQQLNLLGE
jgi:hypothetical protein